MQRHDTKARRIKSCGEKVGYRSLIFQTGGTVLDGNWQDLFCGYRRGW